MNYLKLLPIPLVFALPTAALAQYPIIFNHIKFVSIDQEACIRRSEVAVKSTGFDRNFELIGDGAFAVNGNYSVSVRCEMSRGVVFFAVAGPDNNTASKLVERVQNAF
jgi:hypothetical protein